MKNIVTPAGRTRGKTAVSVDLSGRLSLSIAEAAQVTSLSRSFLASSTAPTGSYGGRAISIGRCVRHARSPRSYRSPRSIFCATPMRATL